MRLIELVRALRELAVDQPNLTVRLRVNHHGKPTESLPNSILEYSQDVVNGEVWIGANGEPSPPDVELDYQPAELVEITEPYRPGGQVVARVIAEDDVGWDCWQYTAPIGRLRLKKDDVIQKRVLVNRIPEHDRRNPADLLF